MSSQHNPLADRHIDEPSMPAPRAGFHPIIHGRKVADAAMALTREFGEDAAMAAALRAAQSRAKDNPTTYCHWRDVERLVGWWDAEDSSATRH